MYIIEYLILVFDWLLALWHYLPLPWWQSESTALYTMFSATSRTCAKINCDNTKRHVTTVTPVKNTVLVCHTFCCLLVFLFPYYFYPYSIELFLFIWILTHNTCNSKRHFIKHLIKGRVDHIYITCIWSWCNFWNTIWVCHTQKTIKLEAPINIYLSNKLMISLNQTLICPKFVV